MDERVVLLTAQLRALENADITDPERAAEALVRAWDTLSESATKVLRDLVGMLDCAHWRCELVNTKTHDIWRIIVRAPSEEHAVALAVDHARRIGIAVDLCKAEPYRLGDLVT